MAANSFLFLFLVGILISSTAAAQNAPTFPLRYDPITSQFYTTFHMGSRPASVSAVVDLGAQFLWFSCDRYVSSTYAPIPCDATQTQCQAAGGLGCYGCNRPPRPGCSNDTCGSMPYNPFQNTLVSQGFYQDTLRANAPVRIPQFVFSCMPNDYLEGLARGTTGMLGLARTAISLHKQAADKLGLPDKFSICFPGSGIGKLSVAVLQSGISKSLKSTPLIINPVSTAPIYTQGDASNEYFINVTSISVAGVALSVKDSYFFFDKNGVGGTKISTVQNYTAVHTSIYMPLVRAFNKAASDMEIKSAAAVRPFQACYRSASISRAAGGARVPTIDLVLPGKDVYWRIYGGNSMVEIDEKTTCLAMVDSGKQPRTSIVIGAHQLVENYLEFDLVSSVVNFSSSLLEQNKSCSRL